MAKNDEKYAYLNQLSTEQLEEILRMDLEDAKLGNENAIFHILEVIEQREKELPTGRIPDINEAWGEFQAYYHVPEGEAASLYPSETTADTDSRPLSVPQPAPTHQHSRSHQWLKQSLVAVIAVIAVLGGMLAAQASGIDVFGTIGRWTDEMFHFGSFQEGDSGSTAAAVEAGAPEYDEFREAVVSLGIDESLVPTWCPTGFEPSETEIYSTRSSDIVYLTFTGESDYYFIFTILRYSSEEYLQRTNFEKDSTDVLQYSNGHQTFYIFSNIDTVTAVWSDGLIALQITGNIPNDVLIDMIDSIGGT